jgi:5-methylcytosine-specific restriction endonuclease McrA
MKLNTLLFLVTGFLLVDTYYENKYSKMFKINEKYIKMSMIAFTALTIYVFFKKYPNQSNSMLMHANDIIKYMPIDKHSKDMLTPIIDMTMRKETNQFNTIHGNQINQNIEQFTPQMKRMMNSGSNRNRNQQQQHKRSVSETKKKYVASNQQWKCGHCNQQLDHTFEVDHIQDLQYGGDNSVDNLVALCRNCHGKKTMSSKL